MVLWFSTHDRHLYHLHICVDSLRSVEFNVIGNKFYIVSHFSFTFVLFLVMMRWGGDEVMRICIVALGFSPGWKRSVIFRQDILKTPRSISPRNIISFYVLWKEQTTFKSLLEIPGINLFHFSIFNFPHFSTPFASTLFFPFYIYLV